jgi:hypothetical protein
MTKGRGVSKRLPHRNLHVPMPMEQGSGRFPAFTSPASGRLRGRSLRSKSAAGGGSLHIMTRGDTPTPPSPASGRGSALPSRSLFNPNRSCADGPLF